MSKPKDNSKPEEASEPNSATGRTEVTTNTVVEDFTGKPAVNPYAREAKATVSELGGGTVLETYE